MASLLITYSIGELISLEPISSGVENTNYRLRTTSGRFIVTIYEDRVNTDDLPYFLSVKQDLAQSSLLVPKPIGNKSGQVLFKFGNKFGAIFSHLNGHEVQAIGKDECFIVGETLAKIHSAKMPNALNRPNSMGPDNWLEMWEDFAGRQDISIESDLSWFPEELEFVVNNWPDNLEKGVIHADLFPDNVLFEQGQISGVLDFYFACNDLFAYDLAIAITAWCFDKNNDFAPLLATALLDGYTSCRPLKHAEQLALPILLRGAAIRFSLTRLADSSAKKADVGLQKSPAEFLQRLQFFRSETDSAATDKPAWSQPL